MTIRTLLLASLIAVAPACSKKDPVDKMVSMMEDLGNAVDKSGGDCGKMADGVQAIADKYKDDLEAMKAAAQKAKSDKDQKAELQKKYGDRIEKAMPKLMGMFKCADDPKMKAVEDKLKGLM